ncbi:MAG: hypothetical protein GXO22_04285 [Aquificae bacterium]|nr:hypothetical protein [Aquificota bacterium]
MKYFSSFLMVLFLIGFSFSEEKKEPIFLGVVKNNAIPYLKEIIPSIKIKDVTYMSISRFGGSLFILKNYKNPVDFYIDFEEKAVKELKDFAKTKCKENHFYMLDNFDISITEVEQGGMFFKATCNVICANINLNLGGKK